MVGPDTSNLIMRFGLHSGPVTEGVLCGECSRFSIVWWSGQYGGMDGIV